MKHAPLFDGATVKVLSVRQPWAHLIVSGLKPIENRSWRTSYRGRLYIHAASKMHATPIETIERRFQLSIDPDTLQMGAIIGHVDLVDIVETSTSPWFEGRYGWVLENAREIAPVRFSGQMGIYDVLEKTVRQTP